MTSLLDGSPPGQTSRPSLWRHADFLKLWTGETISVFGSQISQLAIPLAAAHVLHATPAEFGLLAAIEMLPFLVLALPAGVWVDRLRRRPVLIAGDLIRVIALGVIPLTYLTGHLSMAVLYLVALVAGSATVFFDVAYQSYLPVLVEREHLIEGNGKLEVTRSASQVAGPGMAGVLVGLLTAPVAVLLDAVSFLVSAGMLLLIRKPEPAPELRPEGRQGMRAEIAEGLQVILRNPLLRGIAACTATSNFFTSLGFATFILFAVDDLHLGDAQIGLIFAMSSVGGLLGAVISGRVPARLGVGRTLEVSVFSGAIFGLLAPLAQPATAFPLLIAAQFGFSFANPVYNVTQVSLRQSITPDRLQGRMNASMRFIVWGVMPLGSLAGGAVASVIGVRGAVAVGAAGALLAVVPLVLTPIHRLREAPAPWQAAERAGSVSLAVADRPPGGGQEG